MYSSEGEKVNSKNIIGECIKCDGSGHINAFGHIIGGKCFLCNGTGKISGKSVSTYSVPSECIDRQNAQKAWIAKFEQFTVDQTVEMFRAKLTWNQIFNIHSNALETTVAWKAARRLYVEAAA